MSVLARLELIDECLCRRLGLLGLLGDDCKPLVERLVDLLGREDYEIAKKVCLRGARI